MLGVFATALFYGDSMITPAVTVLSAVEGLTTVQQGFAPFVIPAALVILVGLFAIQSRGTARVGAMFGPVMLVYFGVLAVLGLVHIMDQPSVVLAMINPANAVGFFITEPMRAFLAMGSVVLALTGAEALTPTWVTSDAARSRSLGFISSCRPCCSTIWGRARCCFRFRLTRLSRRCETHSSIWPLTSSGYRS